MEYDYHCQKCDRKGTMDFPISKKEIPQTIRCTHEACTGEMIRVISGGAGFNFKGGSPTK